MTSTDADVSPPLSLSSTFTCPEEGVGGHIYSRISNPTRERAEALLAAVESSDAASAHAVLYSSGLSATFAALARLMPARVAISGGYHGTHLVLAQVARISGGRTCQIVPLPSPADAAATLGAGDVLWLETPRNPDCHVYDIGAYSQAARALGAHVVVDGTFAPPPLQRPLELGATMVVHSTTKGLAGHSDAVGGALCVGSAELAAELKAERTAYGSTPGALEPWLLMRSLRTLHLRVARQSASAAAVAAWLQRAVAREPAHALAGAVLSVRHPSLPLDPSHAVATRQMAGGYGGTLALELVSEAAARALPAQLTLFRDATSLGGVESLIEWRRKYDDAVSPRLLRVSVGLEEPELLIADLQQGILRATAGAE